MKSMQAVTNAPTRSIFAVILMLLSMFSFRSARAFRSLRVPVSPPPLTIRRDAVSTDALCFPTSTMLLRQRGALALGLSNNDGQFIDGRRSRRFSKDYSASSASTLLFMASIEEDEAMDSVKSLESEWDIGGLKKEVNKLLMRCHKKASKARERLNNGKALAEELATDPIATLDDLDKCPNVTALEFDTKALTERLVKLSELEVKLAEMKKKKGTIVLPGETAQLALDLGVDDKPPTQQPRGPTKKKGPKISESSRLPYRRYYSFDNIEIRVGKKAEDNDELTLSSKHRDGNDFWMHAAGCPGSHVVIRSNGRISLPGEVVQDAAALAARQSKAKGSPVVAVSITLCRDINKPPGAKAGLVQLTGEVQTVKVNMKDAKKRLDRLDSTLLIN
mmetsp:Transcript_4033/g.5299  ORF Transcript_4033/g.5299 Transcript_4033/m.5299 type:complete len:391 (-) Transcript_4033:160-1332(-)